MQEKQKGLVWFRNDLRVHDNESLTNAIQENDTVIAVYCFDPRHFEQTRFGFKKTEKFRAKFLIESVTVLRQNLEKLNIPLLVYHQKPEDSIPEIVTQNEINSVYFQEEWTSEEMEVLYNIKSKISGSVSFKATYNQFLFHPEDIPFEIQSIPNVFTQFRNQCEKSTKVRPEFAVQQMSEENWIANKTVIPTMETLGFTDFQMDSRTAFPFRGGENEALQRLEQYFWETKKLSVYKLTRNGLIGTDFSSKFSPWLANGSISAKTIYWEIVKYEQQIEKNDSTYWLIFELIWRDYFKYVSMKNGNSIFKIGGILDKKYDWKNNPLAIKNWINGTTEEPFVNANMIELQQTGWMSNRGRQNVGSYFAKNLLLDWRIGAAYFEAMLIDYDVHSNYGNWMYVSGVGNDPRDRKFNIKLQAENYDGQSKFQKLWLQQQLF
ncbi:MULTISPECIES: DASH family cryptochrome [unclassified Flavobacterium]|uniref:DASH family cryptochrome n=1 Tax=unclassified Flavobacterium TaxID=196869 RepID=UPI000C17C553|nr:MULTISPECIES: DASH family cryptochrome [unclassified Flavobacterium]PIF63598.1 deoxyribodipyrimidine photo-lyase (single-stranded DNA-specific) [Flavobacterium sp. 11]WKL44823.1 DASH family cryptochrome [Flavobacterium sp. ZE23DGlu08]